MPSKSRPLVSLWKYGWSSLLGWMGCRTWLGSPRQDAVRQFRRQTGHKLLRGGCEILETGDGKILVVEFGVFAEQVVGLG
ncbi:hypothetical protein KC354_g17 [Hortaea werneckii]|nr:hypothetical protein KC354_g17 [Hortaea werneckii]